MPEPYTPTRQRPTAIGATALKTGVIQLTASAFRELGETEFVETVSPRFTPRTPTNPTTKEN